MTTQHTPAPWHFSGDSLTHRQFDIYAPAQAPQQHVCTVNNLSAEKLAARDAGVALANARLIAAAPDLLKALRALASTARTFRNVPKEEQEWTSIDDDALKAAFAAIAKATGGAA